MKHYLNHTKILFIVFALIVHSLPAVVLSQEFKSLEISKNRVVLNKVLPPSPSDLDRTVKIPMSFTVLPDGTVGEVIPLSKGDPSLEAISIKTLKKWKFNLIEDDIIMKGEITFTFSPDGRDNYTAKEKTLTLTNNKSDDSMQEKYYSVNHHHWGDFMNSHAVWIDTGTLSYEGILYKMMFSTEILEKGIYNYEYSADDSEDVLFDGNSLKNYIDNQNSEKGKLYLHEGIHKIQVAMRNSVINKQFWRDNPAGFAFTLTNERGEIVFTTRDEKHCYKNINTPKYYPVSHPVWNDLLKNHAVWINNKENNHEGEYKDLTFETIIPKSGFYNFEISADDTAEFILDGNKIMDISYQKGIHNFKIKLEEGVHQLQMKVMNFTLNKSKWEDNAVGVAILIKDNLGNVVFSTRDEKYCYKEIIAVQRSSENNKQNISDITIGNQIWMARNLDVDRFRNGDLIYEAKTPEDWGEAESEGKPAWCFMYNDSLYGTTYGRLYNWYAIRDSRGLAPQGYHVPSDDEWKELCSFLGSSRPNEEWCCPTTVDTNAAGYKLKSKIGWDSCLVGGGQVMFNGLILSGNGSNVSGFTGLPGGTVSCFTSLPGGTVWGTQFWGLKDQAYWWSSTEGSSTERHLKEDQVVDYRIYRGNPEAYAYYLSQCSSELIRLSLGKQRGLSVRCIRD